MQNFQFGKKATLFNSSPAAFTASAASSSIDGAKEERQSLYNSSSNVYASAGDPREGKEPKKRGNSVKKSGSDGIDDYSSSSGEWSTAGGRRRLGVGHLIVESIQGEWVRSIPPYENPKNSSKSVAFRFYSYLINNNSIDSLALLAFPVCYYQLTWPHSPFRTYAVHRFYAVGAQGHNRHCSASGDRSASPQAVWRLLHNAPSIFN
jgi:hypothetical protein